MIDLDVESELKVVSAHRTPDWLFEYAEAAESRGLKVIIPGAGGAAHLPGMLAPKTILPIIGVPVPLEHLKGMDSLFSHSSNAKRCPRRHCRNRRSRKIPRY
ncbi:MAG: hypothetical protein Ct9H300mP11_25260 [Chloroflexota bacterium]|nr:MAG: hypothetical protein Ct9H300mP11_25260 [Chloroflexota bacterium]